jgi:hypothetical protein
MKSRTIAKISAALLLACAAVTAGAQESWSPWLMASGDAAIEFRYKVSRWAGMTPSCEVEVRDQLGTLASVRADITVALDTGPVATTRTFWVNTSTQIGTDSIFSCGGVSDFVVTSARRR